MKKRKHAKIATNTDQNAEQLRMAKALREALYLNAARTLGLSRSFGGGAEVGYDGTRDINLVAGYKDVLTFDDFYNAWSRQDIATCVVETYPTYTWLNRPDVYENEKAETTPFETAWEKLVVKHQLTNKLKALDILAGIGEYGVMVLGFDDGMKLDTPVEQAENLIYLRPYMQSEIRIKSWDTDISSPRYMRPYMYTIIPNETKNVTSTQGVPVVDTQFDVHHSRIIHFADGALNSDVFGVPRLKRVYDRLADITKIVAGSAEMFYRGAWNGFSFEAEPEGEFNDDDKLAMKESIKNFMAGLDRALLLKGVKTNQLQPNISSPKEHLDAQLTMVSIASRIPKRILAGSEQGKLASTEDAKNWAKQVKQRSKNEVEPRLLRPFIDRLIEVGVLPTPKDNVYVVEWPDLDMPTTKDTSESAMNFTSALSAYITSNMYEAIPFKEYLVHVWEYSVEEAEAFANKVDVKALSKIREDTAAKAAKAAETPKQMPKAKSTKDETLGV